MTKNKDQKQSINSETSETPGCCSAGALTTTTISQCFSCCFSSAPRSIGTNRTNNDKQIQQIQYKFAWTSILLWYLPSTPETVPTIFAQLKSSEQLSFQQVSFRRARECPARKGAGQCGKECFWKVFVWEFAAGWVIQLRSCGDQYVHLNDKKIWFAWVFANILYIIRWINQLTWKNLPANGWMNHPFVKKPYQLLRRILPSNKMTSWKTQKSSSLPHLRLHDSCLETLKVFLGWFLVLPSASLIGLSPFPVSVTTRIITFLVGDPYKPSFATVTGRGDNPNHWNPTGETSECLLSLLRARNEVVTRRFNQWMDYGLEVWNGWIQS